jgi:hypothetical protein
MRVGTLLLSALVIASVSLIALLRIRASAPLQAEAERFLTSLCALAHRNCIDKARDLRLDLSRSLLHVLAANSQQRALLAASQLYAAFGAGVDPVDLNGATPLHDAARAADRYEDLYNEPIAAMLGGIRFRPSSSYGVHFQLKMCLNV